MARIATVWQPADQNHDRILVTCHAVWAMDLADYRWNIIFETETPTDPEILYHRWQREQRDAAGLHRFCERIQRWLKQWRKIDD